MSSRTICCGLLVLLLNAAIQPASAHNGWIALAYPMPAIEVDGDLSDWPADATVYPIRQNTDAYGETDLSGTDLDTSADLSPEFMVGYNLQEQLIYVAVRARDDQVVAGIGTQETDACEIYATQDIGDSKKYQYVLCPEGGEYRATTYSFSLTGSVETIETEWPNPSMNGMDMKGMRSRGAMGREADTTIYEWQIQLLGSSPQDTLALRADIIIGFDVVVVDKDAEGTAAWVAWSPEPGKGSLHRLGDLILVGDATDEEFLAEYMSSTQTTAIHKFQEEKTRLEKGKLQYQLSFLVGLPLMLALIHAFLFAFYPKSRDNLYYAVFALALALANYAGSVFDIYILSTASVLCFVTGQIALYSSLKVRVRRTEKIYLVLTLVSFMGVVTFGTGLRLSNFELSVVFLFFCFGLLGITTIFFSLLNMTFVIARAIFQRREGAVLVGLGYLAFVSTVIYAFTMEIDFLFLNPTTYRPQFIQTIPYGILALLACMSVHLARTIANTSKNLGVQLGKVEELSAQNLAQERELRREMERELNKAHELQMGLMPTAQPQVAGYDITGRCLTATHVGGDFFQYFPQEKRLSLCMADVTGHAMEAAVPVMIFSGILDNQMETGQPLEELFARLNRSLYRTLDRRTFVCFTMADLEPQQRKLRLLNCGCPYPYHFRAASGRVEELEMDGYPLGVRPDTSYAAIERVLEPGDRIVLASDGIIEAGNESGEIFGFERTAAAIEQGCAQDLAAGALVDHLIAEVQTFAGRAPQDDDMTIVALQTMH